MRGYKNIFIPASIIVVAALAFSAVSFVRADDNGNSRNGESVSESNTNASSTLDNQTQSEVENSQANSSSESRSNGGTLLSIESQGKADVKGATVTAVNGSNLSVSVFGLSLAVAENASSTSLIGAGSADLSSIKAGDVVDVTGQINAPTGVIAAETIKDQTLQTQATQDIMAKIQALLQEIQALKAQLGSQNGN